jgi:hypothetical protein
VHRAIVIDGLYNTYECEPVVGAPVVISVYCVVKEDKGSGLGGMVRPVDTVLSVQLFIQRFAEWFARGGSKVYLSDL